MKKYWRYIFFISSCLLPGSTPVPARTVTLEQIVSREHPDFNSRAAAFDRVLLGRTPADLDAASTPAKP